MREIKYMAWEKVSGKMYQVRELYWSEFAKLQYVTLFGEQFRRSVKELELRECTGLKDKNGREIYEGDILMHEDFEHRKDKVVGVMEWDEKVAGFTRFYPLFRFEVIGNIYENSELVKGE